MRRKEAQLQREQAEKEKLAAKIAAMESKLLSGGGKTIVDHTNEQQRALEQRRAEVAARSAAFFIFFDRLRPLDESLFMLLTIGPVR